MTTSDKSFAMATGPVTSDTTYLCHAAAISGATEAGTYTQTVYITVVNTF